MGMYFTTKSTFAKISIKFIENDQYNGNILRQNSHCGGHPHSQDKCRRPESLAQPRTCTHAFSSYLSYQDASKHQKHKFLTFLCDSREWNINLLRERCPKCWDNTSKHKNHPLYFGFYCGANNSTFTKIDDMKIANILGLPYTFAHFCRLIYR